MISLGDIKRNFFKECQRQREAGTDIISHNNPWQYWYVRMPETKGMLDDKDKKLTAEYQKTQDSISKTTKDVDSTPQEDNNNKNIIIL